MITLPLLLLLAAQGQGAHRLSVDAGRLKTTIESLTSLKNRNTNRPECDAAVQWAAAEFNKIPGLKVEIMHYPLPKSPRVTANKDATQVIAVLPGRNDHRIIIGAHLDTINLTSNPFDGVAPGADDNASGIAVTLELARVLADQQWDQTLVFAAFTGNEQGLFGAKALADRAKSEGWKVDAMLNEDTVGASGNSDGQIDRRSVRLFSASDTPNDDSRELARLVEWVNRQRTTFRAKLVFREDRYLEVGDEMPFQDAGFPVVRFTEAHEDFHRQHTDQDLPKYIDYTYLRNVAVANIRAIAGLARAGLPPEDVRLQQRRGQDTTITWNGNGTEYVVYGRETTSPVWQFADNVGPAHSAIVHGKNKDDYVFAVGARGAVPIIAK